MNKTRGIVLRHIKYKETSIIAKIFTEAYGLQSFIFNGVRQKKSKNKMALFMPLTLLDMVIYPQKSKDAIQRASEIRCSVPLQSLYFDIKKSSVSMFLAEVLSRSLYEGEPNPPLYSFVQEAVIYLDQADHFDNFSIQFMLHLAHHLGFLPHDARDFFGQLYQHNYINRPGSPQEIALLDQLLQAPLHNQIPSHNTLRRSLVDLLLHYFDLHLETFGQIKTLDILREVLS